MHFIPLRTRRFTVQLKELSIGQSIALAGFNEKTEQAALTEFLRMATSTVKGIDDPAKWTITERVFTLCHYLSSMLPDGPDFSVGSYKYSDYMGGSESSKEGEEIELGELSGDVWLIRNLTGAMAESIERLVDDSGLNGCLHWVIGAMAAQLTRKGEIVPEDDLDEWLLDRMKVIVAFPESDFIQLSSLFYEGSERLNNWFNFTFDADGVLILPREGAEDDVPPARFLVRACISKFACSMVE